MNIFTVGAKSFHEDGDADRHDEANSTSHSCVKYVEKDYLNIDHRGFPPYSRVCGDRGSTVVKVLCYKSEGRWFDPSWCHWNFSLA